MPKKMKLADLVCRVKDYYTIYSRRKDSGEKRIIDYDTIGEEGIVDFSLVGYDAHQTPENFNQDALETGDVLITFSERIGHTPDSRIVVVPEEGRGCGLRFSSLAFTLNPGIIKPELVAAYLSSPSVKEYILKISSDLTSNGFGNYNLCDKILALEIMVPDKEKQEKMGEFLLLMKENYVKMKERKIQMELAEAAAVSELLGGEITC